MSSKNNMQMNDTNPDTTQYSKHYRKLIPGSSTYTVHHAGKQSHIHRKHTEPSRADATLEEM
jgi:hypothetical protein